MRYNLTLFFLLFISCIAHADNTAVMVTGKIINDTRLFFEMPEPSELSFDYKSGYLAATKSIMIKGPGVGRFAFILPVGASTTYAVNWYAGDLYPQNVITLGTFTVSVQDTTHATISYQSFNNQFLTCSYKGTPNNPDDSATFTIKTST